MAKEKVMLEKKQDGRIKVKFDSCRGVVIFWWDAIELFRKTIKECEEIYPQYLWLKTKESPNTLFVL